MGGNGNRGESASGACTSSAAQRRHAGWSGRGVAACRRGLTIHVEEMHHVQPVRHLAGVRVGVRGLHVTDLQRVVLEHARPHVVLVGEAPLADVGGGRAVEPDDSGRCGPEAGVSRPRGGRFKQRLKGLTWANHPFSNPDKNESAL